MGRQFSVPAAQEQASAPATVCTEDKAQWASHHITMYRLSPKSQVPED